MAARGFRKWLDYGPSPPGSRNLKATSSQGWPSIARRVIPLRTTSRGPFFFFQRKVLAELSEKHKVPLTSVNRSRRNRVHYSRSTLTRWGRGRVGEVR